MKKKGILKGFFVIFFTIILMLLIGEILLRIFYPLVSNYDLEMWRYSAYGKIPGRNLFHQNRPNAYFRKLYGVEVKINSKGLREYEYTYAKEKNCYRIIVLGDSMTFGWGVRFEETYEKLLEKKLNENRNNVKYQVINMGVGNYNLQDEVTLLKEEGLKYNPDMIIVGCFINDAEIHPPLKYYFLKRYSYLYAFIWSRVNAIENRLNPNRNLVSYYNSLYSLGSKTRMNFEKYISELKMIVKERNIPLLILIMPDLYNFQNYPFLSIHQYIASQFKGSSNTTVIDLWDYFDKNVTPLVYWVSPEDAHYNAKAHRLIAEAILHSPLPI